MRLQTKFNLAIISVFTVLAIGIAIVTINYVNTNTIREAENRVRIYARTAWEIYDSKIERMRSASEILARDPMVLKPLTEPRNGRSLAAVREYLESVRRDQGMDILNLLAADGTVILRTRSPYNAGDKLAADPMIKRVMTTGQVSSGTVILELERLDVEGGGLLERCMSVAQESRGMLSGTAVPILQGKELIGIIQTGSLLNGAVEKVDRIRDAVFANERYRGKPVGTATIFMGDIRISTNVMDSSGRRAVGTRASSEVTDRVLRQGQSWTGKAYVVDTWYISQYDPYAVTFSPNSKYLAVGRDDNTVEIWDVAMNSNVYTYSGHTGNIFTVAWSPDGKRIASGGADATVQVWDALTGGHEYTYRGHLDFYWGHFTSGQEVDTVARSPDGKQIASGGTDNTVQVWQAQ